MVRLPRQDAAPGWAAVADGGWWQRGAAVVEGLLRPGGRGAGVGREEDGGKDG